MLSLDFAILGLHVAFFGAFGVTRGILASLDRRAGAAGAPTPAPAASEERTAPHSRGLLAFHMVAFGAMYFGLFQAVIPSRVPQAFPGQRVVGAALIVMGAALSCWALAWFRSWRFRAQLEKGHELATGGPFALVRHPIYASLNLLALGSAIWVPTPIVWVAFLLMVIGSDLRGRAEEKLLTDAFGDAYRAYCARTKRFVPGVY